MNGLSSSGTSPSSSLAWLSGPVHLPSKLAELVEVLDRHALDTGPKTANADDCHVGVVWHDEVATGPLVHQIRWSIRLPFWPDRCYPSELW